MSLHSLIAEAKRRALLGQGYYRYYGQTGESYSIIQIDFSMDTGKATLTLEDHSTKEVSLDSIYFGSDLPVSQFSINGTEAKIIFPSPVPGKVTTETTEEGETYTILDLGETAGGTEATQSLPYVPKIAWKPGYLIKKIFGPKEYDNVEKVMYYAKSHEATLVTSQGLVDLDNINGVEVVHTGLGYPSLGKDTLVQAGFGMSSVARLVPPDESKFRVKVQNNMLEVYIPPKMG